MLGRLCYNPRNTQAMFVLILQKVLSRLKLEPPVIIVKGLSSPYQALWELILEYLERERQKFEKLL